MSLRITIEVLPGGDERAAYMLGRMWAHNSKMYPNGEEDYCIEMITCYDGRRGGDVTNSMEATFPLKRFDRRLGFWRLVAEALDLWRGGK